MKSYRVDIHIHTILSPCASLEMSPDNIIKAAKANGLDLIGITDHNSTKQCAVVKEIGEKNGVGVLLGAEVCTKEEVHCLAFFEDLVTLNKFQKYLDAYLTIIKNDPIKFGDQVWVNASNEIIGTEQRLLIVAINQSIDEVADKVEHLNGIFIPAHINKARNSVISQLGFLPQELKISALEILGNTDKKQLIQQYNWIDKYKLFKSSDAHFLHQIGERYTDIKLKSPCFNGLKEALKQNVR